MLGFSSDAIGAPLFMYVYVYVSGFTKEENFFPYPNPVL